MPLGLIVVLVMHDAESRFVGPLLSLAASLGRWLQSLEVNRLESLDLHVVDLGELTHLASTTAVGAALPALTLAEIVSKHHGWHSIRI